MKKTSNYNKDTKSLITAAVVALPLLTLCSSPSPPLQLHCSWKYQLPGQNTWINELEPCPKESGLWEVPAPGSYGAAEAAQQPKRNSDPRAAPGKAAAREIPGRSEPHLNLHLPVPSSLRWISTLEQVGAGKYPVTPPEPVLSICWVSCVWSSFEENPKHHFNLLHYYLFKLILLSHQDLL